MKERIINDVKETEKNILAADIALIVEAEKVSSKELVHRDAIVVETKHLVAGDYIDPESEKYKIERDNHIGSIEKNRQTAEGIALWHMTFTVMGEQFWN